MALRSLLAGALVLLPVSQALCPSDCCSVLHSLYQNHTFFPNTTGYKLEAFGSYWSGTAQLNPTCAFTPTTAEMVSEAMKLFKTKGCSFAIRSGGHATATGAANIEGGVLLATTNLSGITLGEDYASVGAGLRWGAVYDFLEPHGLVVVGGRGATVGVAGLVLGGGVSHLTPELGLSCDNVKGFEIVTASGEILEVNLNSHPDLWQALKGSQNMFGVVTRLDLYTYKSPLFHTLTANVNMSDFDQVADAYDNYLRFRSGNKDAFHIAMSMTSYFVSFLGAPFMQVSLLSSLAEGTNDSWVTKQNSAPLSLPSPLSVFDNLAVSAPPTEAWGSMAKLAAGEPSPKLRYDLRTMSFKSSPEMLKRMQQIVEEEFAPAIQTVAGFSGIVEWQPITENSIAEGVRKGGNILGLEGSGPLVFFAMANSWSDASGDEAAHAVAQRIIDRGEVLAKELGTYLPFKYVNYAANGQDSLNSYGEENVAKILQVQQKYDPEGVLKKLLPGGMSGMRV